MDVSSRSRSKPRAIQHVLMHVAWPLSARRTRGSTSPRACSSAPSKPLQSWLMTSLRCRGGCCKPNDIRRIIAQRACQRKEGVPRTWSPKGSTVLRRTRSSRPRATHGTSALWRHGERTIRVCPSPSPDYACGQVSQPAPDSCVERCATPGSGNNAQRSASHVLSRDLLARDAPDLLMDIGHA